MADESRLFAGDAGLWRAPARWQIDLRGVEESCPAGKMEKILGQFENVRAAISTDKLSPRWSTWAFEQGQICFVERPDGWLLGLVVRAESDAVPGLDPLSREFLSLELGK